ncbi:hypothetical protein LTR09_008033 [Extremus antarcticus]|uniref:Uncharacterized protein n=1 Tax=Extremus antarcticus TaxID=702011 RepID=A0AAJ0DI69_9PEZI|nr:hypothetical protein LTR09_008033 [Extremus antarcticus]
MSTSDASRRRRKVSARGERYDRKYGGNNGAANEKNEKLALLGYGGDSDDEFLLSGYRPMLDSLLGSLQSMLCWHNETVNIHLHTLGSLLFLRFPLHFWITLFSRTEGATPGDAMVFIIYFLGVAVCFACSASCHVLWNLNQKAASFGNKLDLCGIVLLMWSASVASVHFAFVCDPGLRLVRWALITVSATGCIFFTLHPPFIAPAFRAYRAMMYTSLGVSGLVFIAH